MKVKLIVEGGAMAPGPAVAQQLGPMGINIGKVIEDVNTATKGFKGTKVPVELNVDPKTKTYEIAVFSPPVAELLKKSLSLDKGSSQPHKIKVGNIAMESIIGIAKTKMTDLLAKDLKAAVKLVVGTSVSLGLLIDNKPAKEIMIEIADGKYDSLIKEEKTEISPEKQADLKKHFAEIKEKQDKELKAEEAAAATAEAEKVAAAKKAAATPEGEAPAATEAPAEGAEEGKAETKPEPEAEKKA